ncbi:MAG TPA: MBL fold metallo-hydrolase [Archaeoglobaceae archaeon]|nr:MBL fold metallo-hydrolase [Archaeoglobaceae archaeon]
MRVYILSDNRVVQPRPKNLIAEWGFSSLIDVNGKYILFDAGQRTAIHNSILINAPLNDIKKIVLSHGHYDHTTGLREILNFKKADLYLHPDAWLTRYLKGEQIGIPWKKEEIESLTKIFEHREAVEIEKNVWALGEIPRKYDYPRLDAYILKDGEKLRDNIKDDQSIAVKTSNGVILILGCCHAGLRNTVEHAEDVTGDEVRSIVGGTHFIGMKDDEIKDVAGWLNSKIDLVATCHCTGPKGEIILSSIIGEKFREVGAGSVIDFQ